MSEAELQALARHYLDPSTGLYNYLRFHADIKALEREEEGGEGSEPPRPSSAKVCTCHGAHLLVKQFASSSVLWLYKVYTCVAYISIGACCILCVLISY